MEKIFVPHELKTIEIDVEKKICKVNGEDFGHGCTEFVIWCSDIDNIKVRLEIGTTLRFLNYKETQLAEDTEHPALF